MNEIKIPYYVPTNFFSVELRALVGDDDVDGGGGPRLQCAI